MINKIDNSTYFNGNAIVHHQQLTLEGSKISGIASVVNGAKQDSLVVPGFIDLQIYGAGGKLFSAEPSVEALVHIENELLKTGTTGFLACIATNTPAVFEQCITTAKAHRSIAKNCLGLHLEGPFINAKRRGAHVVEYIRKATLDEVKALLDFGDGVIKMMTIAPELQNDQVLQYLLDNGVVVSLGHSDASFDEATHAYDKGVQTTTHLFNAMSPLHHREPGIPAAVFNHSRAMASIIADNQHVSFEVVKMAHRLLKERLFLITDAVTACATGPYQHQALGDKFVMPDGTLSGSSLSMLQAVKNCVNDCEIELIDALKMASQYPAQLIGLGASIGKIAPGADANLLVLDESLDLKEVIFKGEPI